MADMLSNGADWLRGQIASALSQGVTYRRGSQSVSWTATLGRRVFPVETVPGGALEKFETRDFIGSASDLGLVPQEGDTIDLSVGGVMQTFQVLAPASNEPAFTYSDSLKTIIRIHTKQVG